LKNFTKNQSTNFPGFVGILFILARQQKKKQQEKLLRIAGKVRESFTKRKKQLNPYSGKQQPVLKVYAN
jgi:hypothetical protein